MSVAPLSGGPEALADQLRDYAAAGLDHVQLWIEPNTVAGYEAFGRVLELLDLELIRFSGIQVLLQICWCDDL